MDHIDAVASCDLDWPVCHIDSVRDNSCGSGRGEGKPPGIASDVQQPGTLECEVGFMCLHYLQDDTGSAVSHRGTLPPHDEVLLVVVVVRVMQCRSFLD